MVDDPAGGAPHHLPPPTPLGLKAPVVFGDSEPVDTRIRIFRGQPLTAHLLAAYASTPTLPSPLQGWLPACRAGLAGRASHPLDVINLLSDQPSWSLPEFIPWWGGPNDDQGPSKRIQQRAGVLDQAYAAHPKRFVRKPPRPTPLHKAVWINKPKDQDGGKEENLTPQSAQTAP